MESKVREATNDEAWGPTGQLMQELAQATFSYEYFPEVMSMLWRRMLIDNQTNWRRTYKALVVLNYLIKNGAERVVTSAREHIYDLKSLENYAFVDETGKDCGVNVRLRVKQLIEFIQDDDILREERKKAKKNRDKYVGVASDGSASSSSLRKLGLRYNDSFSDSVNYDSNEMSSSQISEKPKENKSKNLNRNNTENETNNNQPVVVKNNTGENVKSATVPDSFSSNNNKPSRDLFDDSIIMSEPKPVETGNVLDLFSDDFGGLAAKPVEQSDNFDSSTKVASVIPQKTTSTTDEADLKAIVKNIDIFSNKRPRPPRSNKSNIPDLTLKNPHLNNSSNLRPISSNVEKKSVPIETSSNKKASSSDLDDSLFSLGYPTAPNATTTTIPGSLNNQNLNQSKSLSSPIDGFDLLSINNPVPSSQPTITTTLENSFAKPPTNSNNVMKPSNALNEISSLNLMMNDGLFELNQMPSTTFGTSTPASSGTLSPMQLQQQQNLAAMCSTNVLNASKLNNQKSTKLPDSWNSLVTGTKFNIDLDNLLGPDTKKGDAPSLNQLAKSNKPSADDLFG